MAGELSGASTSEGLAQAASAFSKAFWVPTVCTGAALFMAFRLPNHRVVPEGTTGVLADAQD